MQKGILAARRQMALSSITSSMKDLASQGLINSDLADQLENIRHNNKEYESLFQLELVAQILSGLSPTGQDLRHLDHIADLKNAAVIILTEVEGLTKTSREAIVTWANAQGAED